MSGISFRFLFIFSVLALGLASATSDRYLSALAQLGANPYQNQISSYEVIRDLPLTVHSSMDGFQTAQGVSIPSEPDPTLGPARDPKTGEVRWARLRVLSENPEAEVYVVGDFNQWGENLSDSDKMRELQPPYLEAAVPLRHGMQYRLALRRPDGSFHQVLDPASDTLTSSGYLNSVFWDRDRPGAYRMTAPPVDLRGKAIVLAESEVGAMVAKWKSGDQMGPPSPDQTYRFVAESGVIDRLASMGYNAIELMPFVTTIDGGDWRFRYLDYGIFGPDSRYGTPDDFAEMMDAFNRKGLGVVMDAVVGHFPGRGNLGERALSSIGLLAWLNQNGGWLFGNVRTEWGTYRYHFEDPYVRRMLSDSVLTFFKKYRMSGVRFDNVDGMRFYKPGGGEELLRDFAQELRAYRPDALVIGECFTSDDRLLRSLPERGVGITARNDGHLFDFFQDSLMAPSQKIDLQRLRRTIREGWSGGDAPRIGYLTDHDESANKRGGATGFYPAQLVANSGADDAEIQQRTKAFGSLPLLTHSWTMDLPQMRFLQQGSFNKNPEIDWELGDTGAGLATSRYFTALSKLVTGADAFAFQNFSPEIESYTDDSNQVMVFQRENFGSGQVFYAVIGFNDAPLSNYAVGVEASKSFSIALDSDRPEYGGEGLLQRASPTGILPVQSTSAQAKSRSVVLPVLPAYGVVVLQGTR